MNERFALRQPGSFRRSIEILLEVAERQAAGESYESLLPLIEEGEALWAELAGRERELYHGLSADLYIISGEEITGPELHDSRERQRLLMAAYSGEQWLKVLALIREGYDPEYRALMAHFRARAYRSLIGPFVSLVFSRFAAQEGRFRAGYMEDLDATGQGRTAVELARQIVADEEASTFDLFNACDLLFRHSLYAGEQEPTVEEVATALEKFISLGGRRKDIGDVFLAIACQKKGACLEELDREKEALREYDRALEFYATDDHSLVARGLLFERWAQAGAVKFKTKALADFQTAVDLGTNLAISYLYAAHGALRQGEYGKSLGLCERGLTRPGPPPDVVRELRKVAEAAEAKQIIDVPIAPHGAARNVASYSAPAEVVGYAMGT